MKADKIQAIKTARRIIESGPVYLDTETTGLDGKAEVVDMAIIGYDGTVLVNTLVRPISPIPASASAIHGIKNEDVALAPTFGEILPDLQTYQNRMTVIYNRNFDLRLLAQSAKVNKVDWFPPPDSICAMKLYAKFYGDWSEYRQSYSWQKQSEAARQLGIEIPADLHRAADDANLCRLIVEAMAATPLPGEAEQSSHMLQVILSSPILVEDGNFTRKTITQKQAQKWVDENGPVNFSVHRTVKILGIEPAATRENTPSYDEALIISPNERLQFGREYTKEEIEKIGVTFVLITKEKNN